MMVYEHPMLVCLNEADYIWVRLANSAHALYLHLWMCRFVEQFVFGANNSSRFMV